MTPQRKNKHESKEEKLNPLSANPTKWSKTLKKFAGNLTTNCFSVFDHFVELAYEGLTCTQFITFLGITSKALMMLGNVFVKSLNHCIRKTIFSHNV